MGSLHTLAATTAILASLLPSIVSAQLRVQFNPSTVRLVDEPDYHPWTVETEATESNTTINDLAFTLSVPSDSYLDGNYYKYQYTRFVSHLGERVVSQGVTTSEDNPGPITLSIEGLEEGEHSLLMWHNAWDDLGDGELAMVEVEVDGEVVASVCFSLTALGRWVFGTNWVWLCRMWNNPLGLIIFGSPRLRILPSLLGRGMGL